MEKIDYIKGLKENNQEVLRLIYSNYSDRIRNYILSKGGTNEIAKDVFQDALIIVYNKSLELDFQLTSQFYTYFFGVCKFVFLRKSQKKSNNTVTIFEDNGYIDEENIEKKIIQQEKFRLFERNLQKMGTLCKELLITFFEGTSMNTIAEKFNLKNEHTARNRKYRCQKKLEELIRADEYFEELSHR